MSESSCDDSRRIPSSRVWARHLRADLAPGRQNAQMPDSLSAASGDIFREGHSGHSFHTERLERTPSNPRSAYYMSRKAMHSRSGIHQRLRREHTGSQKKFGRRRALLIGISYDDEKHIEALKHQRGNLVVRPLSGCRDDTTAISRLLLRFGWQVDDIRVLCDDTKNAQFLPTRQNLLDGFRWLVHDARPGDVFFLSFSGHGSQELDLHGFEEDGLNETILPLDWEENGVIKDDELNALLIQPLPSGCKLVSVIDACHSGTMLDLPLEWAGRWKEEPNPLHTKGDVVLLSGCRDSELSADGRRGGAMTQAFLTVLYRNRNISCVAMLAQIHKELRRRGHLQRPVLSSSQRFGINRPFTLDNTSIVCNANRSLGRHFQRHFKPRKEFKSWQRFALTMLVGVILAICAGCVVGYSTLPWAGFVVAGCCLLCFFACGIYWSHPDSYAQTRFLFLRIGDCIENLYSEPEPKTRCLPKK